MKLDETKGGEQRMHEFAIKSSGKRRSGRERKKRGKATRRETEREQREVGSENRPKV